MTTFNSDVDEPDTPKKPVSRSKLEQQQAAHIRLFREYLEYRVKQLEHELKRAEYRLEEAQEALSMFEAKANLALRANS